MSQTNFHTHTYYCDGSSAPSEYVDEALLKSFSALGFSAHAPLYFENEWSLINENRSDYCAEINRLKSVYGDKIDVFLGYEADYIPELSTPFDQLRKEDCVDFIIGAVHLVLGSGTGDLWFIDGPVENFDKGLLQIFDNNIHKAIKCYFEQLTEMVTTQKPDVIAHLDKIKMNNKGRFFSGDESWYRDLLMTALEEISRTGCIVEINTRGVYTGRYSDLYPARDHFRLIKSLNIPITISSDAHKPKDISRYFYETKEILRNEGFDSQLILSRKGWIEAPL